jgi:tetratricopeptide (TPR) repeat protein
MSSKRTLWQILAVYVGASWVILQVVDIVKDNMGLPDWVFPFALLLLLIGLPIIVATAMVQGRYAALIAAAQAAPIDSQQPAPALPEPEAHHSLLTWKNAIVGGGLALALLVLVTAGFMYMRGSGIGPVGSLVAKGMLDERSPVILTDFIADDAGLSRAATQAFRVDLSQTKIVRVLEPSAYAGALERMQRDPAAPLSVEVAREVAVREGIPAVITGEIVEAGGSYVLTASVIAAPDGSVLASHRETAKDDSDIIPSIDRLSRRIREKIGESYTSLRADPPLAAVTTASLEALKLYSEALEAIEREGATGAGIPLLEEALAIDPEFASAWRKLGVQIGNARLQRSRRYEALTKAYELRDRLTPRERYLAEASYYTTVREDDAGAIAAYERMLDLDPNDNWALNNLAVIHRGNGDNERALELFERAAATDSGPIELGNVAGTQILLGQFDAALETAAAGHRLHPAAPAFYGGEISVAQNREDYEEVLASIDRLKADLPDDPGAQIRAEFALANLAYLQGRFEDGIAHSREANALVRRENSSGGRYDWATAWITLEERADTAGAARFVSEMLSEKPLEELEPLDRGYFGFVRIYSAMGDESRARAMMAAFHEAVPDAPDDRWTDDEAAMEAQLAQVAGRYDEAIEHWERLRELEPGCTRCGTEDIGRAHDAAGRPDEAIEWYRRDLDVPFWGRPPNRGRTFERLGQLYDETGDVDNAALYYARFVELWANADDELQPRVRAAQARLEQILNERG